MHAVSATPVRRRVDRPRPLRRAADLRRPVRRRHDHPAVPRLASPPTTTGRSSLFGNNLLTCSGVAHTAPRHSVRSARDPSGTQLNNNSYFMVNVDADGATFPTYNSSSLKSRRRPTAPCCGPGLYWARPRPGAGTGAAHTPAPAAATVNLRAPATSIYRHDHVQALRSVHDNQPRLSTVRQRHHRRPERRPGHVLGANVPAATGEIATPVGRSSSRSATPTLPLRNLTVFDGFSDVGQATRNGDISGFLAPLAGASTRSSGTVDVGGRRRSSGDRVTLERRRLATTLSQAAPTSSTAPSIATASRSPSRAPSDGNLFGVDIKDFGAPGIIPNGATSATVRTGSRRARAVLHRRRDHGDQPVLARLHDEHEGGRQPERPRPFRAGRHRSRTRST